MKSKQFIITNFPCIIKYFIDTRIHFFILIRKSIVTSDCDAQTGFVVTNIVVDARNIANNIKLYA